MLKGSNGTPNKNHCVKTHLNGWRTPQSSMLSDPTAHGVAAPRNVISSEGLKIGRKPPRGSHCGYSTLIQEALGGYLRDSGRKINSTNAAAPSCVKIFSCRRWKCIVGTTVVPRCSHFSLSRIGPPEIRFTSSILAIRPASGQSKYAFVKFAWCLCRRFHLRALLVT